jgi:hypothetical protein
MISLPLQACHTGSISRLMLSPGIDLGANKKGAAYG